MRILTTKSIFEKDEWQKVIARLNDCEFIAPVDSLEGNHDVQFDFALVSNLHDAQIGIEQGKHVCIEAEVDYADSDAKSLLSTSQERNLNVTIIPLPIQESGIQAIRDKLMSGKLGSPGLLRVHRWSCPAAASVRSTMFGDIHLAINFFDSIPSAVYAIQNQEGAYLQVHLGFPLGGMAVLDYSTNLPSDQKYQSLSLIGSKGAAYADDHRNAQLVLTNGSSKARIGDSGDGRLNGLREFVQQIRSNEYSGEHVEMVQQSFDVANAVDQSIASKLVMHEQGGNYEPAA